MKYGNVLFIVLYILYYSSIAQATKQEAFVSLMILSKSKADYDRDFQLRIIAGHNVTINNNYEISQLMKKAESVNMTKLIVKNQTISTNSSSIPNNQKKNLKGK